ncbi:hypothetical protein Ddc_05775 [Ditylenchus destructor]|nr:hypothetical protein Ddc_05775 [Ditylenchus destructor]
MVLFVTILPNVSPKRRSHKTTNDKIWDDGYMESYENPSSSVMPFFSPCTFPIHPAAARFHIPCPAIFKRWFPVENPCTRPRIMILIVLDGILMDTRKLTSVNIYTENRHFTPSTAWRGFGRSYRSTGIRFTRIL